MSKFSIFSEYYQFLKSERKWWMLPIVFLLFILGVAIVLVEGSALAPFIYAIF